MSALRFFPSLFALILLGCASAPESVELAESPTQGGATILDADMSSALLDGVGNLESALRRGFKKSSREYVDTAKLSRCVKTIQRFYSPGEMRRAWGARLEEKLNLEERKKISAFLNGPGAEITNALRRVRTAHGARELSAFVAIHPAHDWNEAQIKQSRRLFEMTEEMPLSMSLTFDLLSDLELVLAQELNPSLRGIFDQWRSTRDAARALFERNMIRARIVEYFYASQNYSHLAEQRWRKFWQSPIGQKYIEARKAALTEVLRERHGFSKKRLERDGCAEELSVH